MLERVPPQGEMERLHPLTSAHLAQLDHGFAVAEPEHSDCMWCGARRDRFQAPVAQQHFLVCVSHEWVWVEYVLESRSLYAHS
jgi:hypothetical protein